MMGAAQNRSDLAVDATLPSGVTERFYWIHERVNLSGSEPNLSRKLYFDISVDFPPGFTLADLRIATYNPTPTKWSAITTGWALGADHMYQTGDNSSNYPAWTFGSIGALILPIDIIYFTGHTTNKTIELEWATAQEVNNNYFTLEKSSDGIVFDEIGLVNGAGNTVTLQEYRFTDHSPFNGISYYRLKQTDFNGNLEYFNTLAINYMFDVTIFNLSISPNPLVNYSYIEIEGYISSEEVSTISIYDIGGRLLYTNLYEGGPFRISKNESSYQLISGIYLVVITSKQGRATKRLVVQ